MKFVVPPEGGLADNYTENKDYVVGERMDISWVGGSVDNKYNLVMFQNRDPDAEVIQRDVPSEGGLSWTVGTSKNIELSGVFYFELQIQTDYGGVKAGPTCHYFNIVSVAAMASSSSRVSGQITAASGSRAPVAPTVNGDSSPGAGSMSNKTMIGFGVGIPAAILAGILIGWLWLRSRRRRERAITEASDIGSGTERDIYSKAGLPAVYRRAVKPELPG
ncbi:hypothetical protein PG993_003054 [Apiospora rasikravindrae]|uniref:Uncharacterized protein n=1 Tax=Apiospora rasikravindrae TaxID=990691 RepID=A0ABR1TYF8_9PEZI